MPILTEDELCCKHQITEEPGSGSNEPENRLLDGSKRRTALNQVYACGDIDVSGARTLYSIWRGDHSISTGILFQDGPRRIDPNGDEGVQDIDLLLMVEDRLIAIQDGQFACDECARAIIGVQAAIKNLVDREERYLREG